MPLFFNASSQPVSYMLVNYKCLFSQFGTATEWQRLNEVMTVRLMLRAQIKTPGASYGIIMRNPYSRTVSCFKDKYRKQPTRIHEQNFEWQECHQIVFDRIGISPNFNDDEKAAALLALTFKDFIRILPEIYHLDGHFHPQHWLFRIYWRRLSLAKIPHMTILNMEDPEHLASIPKLNLGIRTNSTRHVSNDFEWDDETREIVRILYKEDFSLGGYSL